MRTLEPILRNAPRPLPSVADARAAWRAFRAEHGYKGEAKLLSHEGNTKLDKGDRDIYGLTLIAHEASGYNVCPMATAGCAEACVLMTAGRGVMSNVRKARTVKVLFAAEYPGEFLAILLGELASLSGSGVLVRLNVASDIRWEYVIPEAFELDVEYYDYTKWPTTKRGELDNYRIVYSRNERDGDYPATRYLESGGTAAVVFDRLPKSWHGFPVIDGDLHDDRTAEAPGTVVGLKAKGAAKRDASGFVVKVG